MSERLDEAKRRVAKGQVDSEGVLRETVRIPAELIPEDLEKRGHHIWCNGQRGPVVGCRWCNPRPNEGLWFSYPYFSECEQEGLAAKHFPNAIPIPAPAAPTPAVSAAAPAKGLVR